MTLDWRAIKHLAEYSVEYNYETGQRNGACRLGPEFMFDLKELRLAAKAAGMELEVRENNYYAVIKGL